MNARRRRAASRLVLRDGSRDGVATLTLNRGDRSTRCRAT